MNTLAVVFVLCLLQFVACIDYDGYLNIKLDHSLCDTAKFCSRGNIALKSIRAGTSVIDQIHFKPEDVEDLKELAEINGFYTIRSTVITSDNNQVEHLSSVKARSFLESGLSDIINVWVLPNGAITQVGFQVTNSSQPLVKESDGYKINSKLYIHYVDQAPVPDTASFIQKLEREREAREKGDLKDNRSFLAKYWMYIVPIALFVLISGAANPEAGSQPAAR